MRRKCAAAGVLALAALLLTGCSLVMTRDPGVWTVQMISYHGEGVPLPEREPTPEAWTPAATPTSAGDVWAVVTAAWPERARRSRPERCGYADSGAQDVTE